MIQQTSFAALATSMGMTYSLLNSFCFLPCGPPPLPALPCFGWLAYTWSHLFQAFFLIPWNMVCYHAALKSSVHWFLPPTDCSSLESNDLFCLWNPQCVAYWSVEKLPCFIFKYLTWQMFTL